MYITESNINFKNLSNLGTVKRIIIHHADSKICSIYDIHKWHLNNGWNGCGYHFLVRKDGSIWRGRPENKLGAHTLNHNSGSLGVCFEGKLNSETLTKEQLTSGKELIVYLCDKYKLNKTDVFEHKDFNSTDCPGNNFPFNEIVFSESIGNIETVDIKSWLDRLKKECYKQGFNLYPTIKKGARGNITKLIQEKLVSLGYNTNGIDGIFGSYTYIAVKQFQRDNKLLVDGIVGPQTWHTLIQK